MTNKTIFQVTIATIGWIAVLLQLFLIIENRVTTLPETIVRYFSFFTVESNIIVTVCFSFLWLRPKASFSKFINIPKNNTAITLYILIVGIVYNLILRFLWQPTGHQRVADELLHSVIPILVLVYWKLFTDKSYLQFKHIFLWLIFPSIFLAYTLIRGYFVAWYPYPFLDVLALGYKTVLINSFLMLLAFLAVGSFLVAMKRRQKRE